MSMDAGGLAQMTYSPNPFDNSNRLFGAPSAGFASRGKASHIKRLSVALPPKISTIDEAHQNDVNTPRTSRGHMLAGLRTAPKSATVPSINLEQGRYGDQNCSHRMPQTATGAYFGGQAGRMNGLQMYSLPEHVLAPPKIELEEQGDVDQKYYDELMATNAYLAQQQRALQQQLMDVQAAAQLANMNLNGYGSQFGQSPNMNLYSQQVQQGIQPVIQAVPGTPGLYQVYNPMTGQTNLVMDNSAQSSYDLPQSPVSQGQNINRRMSPPSEPLSRGRSPPKSTPSPPQDVQPLPPPSANAFRRGHKKGLSSVNNIRTDGSIDSAPPKSAAIVQTPLTGTFGPGQGQAGIRPVRQPRNPINVHELMDAPTSKHPNSKNFVARQRRRAVQDLVKAGRERQSETRHSGSGSGTPGSEVEFNFSVSSDNDASGSGSLSKRTSIGSLRAAAVGAIGSERKEKSRERGSVDSISTYSVRSLSSDEEAEVIGETGGRRMAALLVLSSAEKRKSSLPTAV